MTPFSKSLIRLPIGSAVLALTMGCASPSVETNQTGAEGSTTFTEQTLPEGQATAVFAMGCFWCAESDFEKLDGVISVVSGYTGGDVENPTYKQVTFTETGHYEAVLVTYDTSKLSYKDLLATFWTNIDPFDDKGQFCDKGTSYRAAIFPGTKGETRAAEKSKERRTKQLQEEPVTGILPRSEFYIAEEYHQDYYKKNPVRYRLYRSGCGRDARLDEVWGLDAK